MTKLLLYINFTFLLFLIIFSIGSLINPAFWPLLNLSGVILPYGAICILIYFSFFLFFKPTNKWIYFLGIFISLVILWKSYYLNNSSISSEKSHITVLSYNTSFFSVHKVFKKSYYDSLQNQEVQRIREFILSKNPDVICLQEFFNDENSTIYNTIQQFEKLGYRYFLKSNPRHDNGLDRGIITFSRYPILKSGIIAHSKNDYNGAIFTDIVLPHEKRVRVINVHLASMELYKGNRSWRNFAGFFYRAYTSATTERIEQGKKIKSYIEDSPFNVIVAGDFNDTQYSYVYRSFKSVLNNSHEERGKGLGYTFPFNIPGVGVRIDHMFYSKGLEAQKFNTFSNIEYSEHKPILGSYNYVDLLKDKN